MKKKDLIRRVSKRTWMSGQVCERIIDAFLDEVADSVTKGERVRLAGFGTFSAVERRERVGRNPRTGEPVRIPARLRVVFKPGFEVPGDMDKK